MLDKPETHLTCSFLGVYVAGDSGAYLNPGQLGLNSGQGHSNDQRSSRNQPSPSLAASTGNFLGNAFQYIS